MPTYEELLALERSAWLAYLDYMDELREHGWDDSNQVEKAAALLALYVSWRDARDNLGGQY